MKKLSALFTVERIEYAWESYADDELTDFTCHRVKTNDVSK